MTNWLQILIQLIDEGDTGGNVQGQNLLFTQVVEVLHKSAKGIPVSGHQNLLSALHRRGDLAVPVGENTFHRIFQAFSLWQFRLGHILVTRIMAREAFVALLQGWWRHIVAAAPNENLIVSELCGGFGLVQSLEP